MSKKANPTIVGGFVVGAIALAIAGIMILGGRSFREERFTGTMYFDESVSGLDVGAPVDFQGVRIGTVTGVRIELDATRDGAAYRPVTFQIELNRIHFRGGRAAKRGEVMEQVERMVQERGLRARLGTQSILTGKLKVEMGFFPETPVNRALRDTGLWEMPTIPSPLAAAIMELQQLPVPDMIAEAYRVVRNLGDLLDPERTEPTVKVLNEMLAHLNDLIKQVIHTLDPITSEGLGAIADGRALLHQLPAILREIPAILRDFEANSEKLLDSMTETSERVGNLLNPESPMRGEVNQLISEIQQTSRAIRLLIEYLEQHPESLLRGKR